ncbi:MAG: ferredoxin-type protein NapF [Gammaproteobacteria bacterium SHHR-1]|uniref:ferredoxin-type protein NapF n=1 Tax=Magnetovirga frankeli TaxID=947516 RepID=UPI001292E291|nr:ferredoxin-type protein NapF [gamma proteobacterium SS-5]
MNQASTQAVDQSRRNLLRGRVRPVDAPLRPPWALSEGFEARCSRCGDCVRACPEGILIGGDGGFPEVDFRRGACSFCAECVSACAPAALDKAQPRPWRIKAEIGADCLSVRGISCRSCGDVCDPRAIRFQLQLGGRAQPLLERGFCTGCGACQAVCPVQAVSLRSAVDTATQNPIDDRPTGDR